MDLRGRGLTLAQLQQELQRMGTPSKAFVLDLRDNALTSPPWFLGSVPGLVALALQGNSDLPRELLEADAKGLSLEYLREDAAERVSVRRCQSIMVGHAACGKTTTINGLVVCGSRPLLADCEDVKALDEVYPCCKCYASYVWYVCSWRKC